MIGQADTVPLPNILRHYGIRINPYDRKIVCPFKSHKGGRESSASFYYYPETNSFYCFGCSRGGPHAHGCRFVSIMDSINEYAAAHKILELFSSDVDDSLILDNSSDLSERLKIMLDFSNEVRIFRQKNSDEKSEQFIENISSVYDAMNLKHDLTNEALQAVAEELKSRIREYQE